MISRLLAAVLLLGVLSGCNDDDSSAPEPAPVSTARPAQPARVPEVGACYRMSYEAALAPTSTHHAVSCHDPHTARTYFVGTLDLVVAGHLLAVDSSRAHAEVTRACRSRFRAYVGGSTQARRLSMLVGFGFSPTVAQSERGQEWYRCDVFAAEAPGRLAHLSGRLHGVLDSAQGRARWGLCATAKPGTDGSEHVLCSEDDAWRAVSTIAIAPASRGSWPGLDAAKAAGDACEDRVRALADDPLNFSWGYEWPTVQQWKAGQHYGFCWAPRDN